MRLPRRSPDVRLDGLAVAAAADSELFALIARGSQPAFRALWSRYGPAVYHACLEIVRDPGAAEDATQEAFVRIWRGAGSVDARRGAPAAWLFTVARNAARNVARVRHPMPVHDAAAVEPEVSDDHTLDTFWVRASVGRLPDDEREAVALAYFADLSHSQIALRLGEPLGTVKSRIRRGLSRMADMLGER